MDSFQSDYYGQRCRSGKKSSDIFDDYVDLLDGVLHMMNLRSIGN
jgi:hypothetical protein